MKNNVSDNFFNFQPLNSNILKNFERLNSLNDKCLNLESFYLSKIIERINEKISNLEESLKDSAGDSDNNRYAEEKINSIELALQNLEMEFESLEEKTDFFNTNISEKINQKIEENYKILGEIDKLTNNKIINKLNITAMNNSESNYSVDTLKDETEVMNDNWLESDWNSIVENEPVSAVNFTDNFKQTTLKNKLMEIEERIKTITTKRRYIENFNNEGHKDDLLRKLVMTEQKISELKLNLSKQ